VRILKGSFKGVELAVPDSVGVRPTVDHLKKHVLRLFETSRHDSIWDLFAGSGGVGLEMLSNGSRRAVFVEQLKVALGCLNLNVAECRLKNPTDFESKNIQTVCAPVETFLKTPDKFGISESPDLIFMDPPYGEGWVKKVLPLIMNCELVSKDTVLIVEHVIDDPLGPFGEKAELMAEETYGPKRLSVVRIIQAN
jgi:16S rRNA (guanine966-N2)-methyltransferase